MTTPKPTPEAQAAAWAKEHATPGAQLLGLIDNLSTRDVVRLWVVSQAGDAYLAGYLAGEQAGIEKERARVCVWTRVRDNEYSDHRRGCNGQMLAIGFVTDGDYCSRCGGRIEVKA